MEFTPSPNCIKLIQHFESCKEPIPGRPGLLKAYKDSKGIWTIGWGCIFLDLKGTPRRRVIKGDIISQQQADYMFKAELIAFAHDVNFLIKGVQGLQQQHFDALTSFAYNLGSDIDSDDVAEGLGDSTLLKLVKKNPLDPEIGLQFQLWRNRGTDYEMGLWRRRKAEAWLYFNNELKFEFTKPYRLNMAA